MLKWRGSEGWNNFYRNGLKTKYSQFAHSENTKAVLISQ